MTIDPRAAAFGDEAERYERVRPSWPEAALDAALITGPGPVVDLAAGTGKLTRLLVPRAERVIAVEPLDGMRAVLERVVPEADVRAGDAVSLPVDDASVEAVFVGEAFHWFATDEAVASIARVLKPGGALALLWNFEQWRGLPFIREVWSIVAPLRGELVHPVERGTWDAVDASPAFGPVERLEFPWAREVSRDEFVDLIGTWSWVAGRLDVLERVRSVVPEGRFALEYVTVLALSRLQQGGGEG